MALYIVATPIGNLGDISKRALEVLKTVPLVIVEKWSDSIKLLNYFNIKPGRLISYDEQNKRKMTPELLKILENSDAALITSAGTPAVSDPGAELVRRCHQSRILVIPVPGPSALATAICASGFQGDFLFIGYLPKKKSQILERFKEAEAGRYSLVFFESTYRMEKTLEILEKNYPETEIFIGKEMTKIFERYETGKPRRFLDIIKSDGKFTLGEFTFILNFNNFNG